MSEDDPAAWGEYYDRFHPLLERRASQLGIARGDWTLCVDDVLEEVGIKMACGKVAATESLGQYLAAAVRSRFLEIRRAERRRQATLAAAEAVHDGAGEGVVATACSQSMRDVAGDGPAETGEVTAVVRLARLLDETVDEEERQILAWVAANVPQRQIAEWLDVPYERARKRIQRLLARLRRLAELRIREFSTAERAHIARLLGTRTVASRRGHG